MNAPSLVDQNILITGAAGRIGSAVAKLCLAHGATVLLADISTKSLDRLLLDLSSFETDRIYSFVADTSTAAGINSLVELASSSTGCIDAAVHCAYPRSNGWGTKFEDIQDHQLFEDLNMQLGGAILFSQSILRLFHDQGRGNLIHLSSIQGIRAPKFEHYKGTTMSSPVEYAAIKAGIISIVRWLSKYYSNQGIRVNCVSPGGILDSQPSLFLDRYRESCTNIGMLSADQVASVVLFLLSPASAAINGQNVIVDDGWSL